MILFHNNYAEAPQEYQKYADDTFCGQVARMLVPVMMAKDPDWSLTFHRIKRALSLEGTILHPDSHAAVFGLSVAVDLFLNRKSINKYNDVTICMIFAKENDFDSQPFHLIKGAGVNPDRDLESATGKSMAIGMGQKHWNNADVIFRHLGIDNYQERQEMFRSLGAMPWWIQVKFMQMGIFAQMRIFSWLSTIHPSTFAYDESNPTTESRYPYFLQGQPKQRLLPVRLLRGSSAFMNAANPLTDIYFPTEAIDVTPEVLIKGVRSDVPNLFFDNVPEDLIIPALAGMKYSSLESKHSMFAAGLEDNMLPKVLEIARSQLTVEVTAVEPDFSDLLDRRQEGSLSARLVIGPAGVSLRQGDYRL